ncbi:hypothetical protein LCGC14_1200040 [marine sediment metagenome]|uniref:Uncharacterized protein n=1 Tax=marine sediment metagenome TaxID=412755 RepID=A0A0F9LLT0_9ZZZZ
MAKKKYKIPEELMDVMAEALAMGKLRDVLVKYRFRFKKAKICAITAERLKAKFWKEVQELYPILSAKGLDYDRGGYVRIIEKAQ